MSARADISRQICLELGHLYI